jgi:hypothetical protein
MPAVISDTLALVLTLALPAALLIAAAILARTTKERHG